MVQLVSKYGAVIGIGLQCSGHGQHTVVLGEKCGAVMRVVERGVCGADTDSSSTFGVQVIGCKLFDANLVVVAPSIVRDVCFPSMSIHIINKESEITTASTNRSSSERCCSKRSFEVV